MVLATKLKNIKPVTKVLCTILALIFAFGAVFSAIDVGLAYACFDSPAILTADAPSNRGFQMSDMPRFKYLIYDNVQLIKGAHLRLMTDEVKKALLDNKDDYIQKGLESYKKQCEDNADDLEAWYTFNYDLDYNDIGLYIDTVELSSGDEVPYLNAGKDKIEAYLNSVFDEYLTKEYFDCTYRTDTFENAYDGFYYQIKDTKTGKVYSNFRDATKLTDVVNYRYYYIYSNDKAEYSKDLARAMDVKNICSKDDNIELAFYVDLNEGHFSHFRDMYNAFANKNVKLKLVMSIIFTLAFIGVSIFVFIVAGKRKENGKVKRAFIDYAPLEIHTAISGGAIAGLVTLFAVVMDGTMPYSFDNSYYFLIRFLAPLICCGIWLLFMEWVTSIVRNAKSDTPFYKTLLIYWIFVGIAKLVKRFVKRVKSLFNKIKDFFSYTLVNFKKRIKLFLIGYGITNIILLILQSIWSCFAYEKNIFVVFAVLNILVIIGLNIASIVFVIRYVIALDKIISSAHNRTMPNVDYDSLPNSLKLLVDSINYSRQELQQAVSKAVKDERMRTELITNVSHDLRTPLTSVINYVDLLKKCDINDNDALEYIDVLEEKSNRLKRLIDDLIEASKITSGVITLNMMSLDLSELATQAVVEQQKDFEDNAISLVFKGDKNNVLAFSDGAKTYRVIENLLSNARKYSAKGTRVYADVYNEGDKAVFEIKNVSAQPLDITPQELKERFVRGDSSRNTQGNGLGLSIADNLCVAMNGALELSIDGDLFKARVILNSHE